MTIKLDKLAGPDGGSKGTRLARFWLDQINSVKDNTIHKQWVRRGEAIIKRYRDERNRTDEEGQRRYSSLWSNVEILKPALYGKTPLPVAERRFKDRDPAGRAAAQILERALRNEIEICGYDEALRQAVGDYLLPGRGTVWVRYEPEIEEGISLSPETETDMRDSQGELPGRYTPPTDQSTTTITPGGRVRPRSLNNSPVLRDEDSAERQRNSPQVEKLRETNDRIIRESTPVDFIEWCDFFTFPVRARNWTEVTAIAKRVYMSRDQMTRRFGRTIGKAIPLQKDQRGDRAQNTMLQTGDEDKGQVYEVWSKDDLSLFWVAIGYDYLCDRKDDPLNLDQFWPVPKPLYANPTNNTLVPVPDFIQYQDQAIQVDELTQRIAMLTKACKMTGVYNAAAKDIQRMFNESIENELIPVDDWAAFGENGGVEGNWSLMPVQVIKDVLTELQQVKQQQIEEMDRLTGLNDILRGTSDPRETLGGVRLKTNNTGTRLTYRQNEVARFARDTIRLMAEIMSMHFSPQSLIEASGALYEEGLGPEDMPPLSVLQGPPPPKPTPGPPGLPGQSGPTPMLGAGAAGPSGQPSPPPAPSPGGPSPMLGGQPGSNIVPFRPPGAPMPPQQPPVGPQMGMGSGLPPLPPELLAKINALQRIAAALTLIRNEKLQGFRVDIEVDSTIFADVAQEKADRTEFITAITTFLEKGAQIGALVPPAVPLLGKLMAFGARGFRIGRDLEMAIEEFTEQATELAHQNAANPKPDPEMLKAQTERDKSQAQIQGIQMKNDAEKAAAQAEVQRQQVENQGEQFNSQADIQIKQLELQMRQMEMEIEKMRAMVDMQKVHSDAQLQGQQAAHEQQKMQHESVQSEREAQHDQQKMHLETQGMAMEHQNEQQRMAMEQQSAAQEHKHQQKIMTREQQASEQAAKHEQTMAKHKETQAKIAASKPKPTSGAA